MTWLGAGQEKRCRDTDLMSRHGSRCLVVVWCCDQGFGSRHGQFCGRSRGWSRHRFEVATWPVEIGCRDLDWSCDLTWCSALFCALFRSMFGSLFMDTVHEHSSQDVKKKKNYKSCKIFLVCDLIYKIFILKLLQMHRRGM